MRAAAPQLAGILLLSAALGAAPAPLEPDPRAREALDMLHQGRFREAAAGFRSLSDRHPGDPEGPLYEALTTWWRLQDSPRDEDLQAALTTRLDEATRRADALLDSGETRRGRLLGGTAYILLAQRLVAAKSLFAAGSAARRGHRLLEGLLEDEAGATDAWFALGAYKYYAARLPWIVRAIRFLTFIPGGDAREGLDGLEKAATEGRFFRFEARLLLAYIHLTEEEDAREALRHLDRAREPRAGSPLLALIRSRVLFESGRLAEAAGSAAEAVELAGRMEGVAVQVVDLAHLRRAQALYYRYRHLEAWEATGPLRRPGGPSLPQGYDERLGALLARLRIDLGAVASLPAGLPAAAGPGGNPIPGAPVPGRGKAAETLSRLARGEIEEGLVGLAAFVREDPGDPVARYHMGRAYQMAGRNGEAISELERALASEQKLPRTLKGWAMIRLGEALRRNGDARRGEDYLKKAANLKGFPFRLAARERLSYPASPPPTEG